MSEFGMRRMVLLLAVMMVFTFAVRLIMLFRSDYAPGLDGYSYAVQTYSVKHYNRVKDPDVSPVLYFLGGLAKIVGDPVVSNKIGAALLAALLLLPAFLLGREISGRAGPGLIAAGLLALSPSMVYLSIEFLKNLGALSGFLFFLWVLLRTGKLGFSTRRVAALGGLFLLCLLAHRTTAILAAVSAGIYFLPRLWKNRRLFLLLVGAGVTGVLFLVLFRGGLHFLDINRFAGVFSFGPFLPVFSGYFRNVLPPGMVIGTTVTVLSPFLLIFFRKVILEDRFLGTLWIVLALLAMPFWDLSKLDMGFRLIVLAVPIAALLWSTVLFRNPVRRKTVSAGLFLFFPLLLLSMTVYNPSRDPDYRFYNEVVRTIDLPEDSLLISHQGMNFFYTYVKWKGRRWEGSLCWLPEYRMPVEKLWRLAHGVTYEEIKRRYPHWVGKGLVRNLPYPYLLIREDRWQLFLQNEPRERVRSLENWYNPHTVRPAYLRVHQEHG